MNSDVSRAIAVDMKAGAEVPALPWLIGILFAVAFIALVLAIVLIAVPVRAAGRVATATGP